MSKTKNEFDKLYGGNNWNKQIPYVDVRQPRQKRKNHIWGVQKYLILKGIEDPYKQLDIIEEYSGLCGFKECSDFIQRDFTSFVLFLKSKKPHQPAAGI